MQHRDTQSSYSKGRLLSGYEIARLCLAHRSLHSGRRRVVSYKCRVATESPGIYRATNAVWDGIAPLGMLSSNSL